MRQAITTKFLGPTSARGSRIKAIARKAGNGHAAQSLTVPYEYRGTEVEHCAAAEALAVKLGWSGVWIGGGNVDEDGYVFVSVSSIADRALRSNLIGLEGRDWFFVEAKEA